MVGVWVIFNSAITMGMYRRARGDGYCDRVRYQNEDDSPWSSPSFRGALGN